MTITYRQVDTKKAEIILNGHQTNWHVCKGILPGYEKHGELYYFTSDSGNVLQSLWGSPIVNTEAKAAKKYISEFAPKSQNLAAYRQAA